MVNKLKLLVFFCICALLCACNGSGTSSDRQFVAKKAQDGVPPGDIKPVFEQKCAVCHGQDGTAGIANAANLQVSRIDSISIIKVVSDGKGAMPSFSRQLTKKEIADLANYILSLRK